MKDFQVYTKEQLEEVVKGKRAGKYELCKQIDGRSYTIQLGEQPNEDRDYTYTFTANFNKSATFIIDSYLSWQEKVLEIIREFAPKCDLLSLTEEMKETLNKLEAERNLDSHKELFCGWDTEFRFWHGITEIRRDGSIGETLTENVIFLKGFGWIDMLYIRIPEPIFRESEKVVVEVNMGDESSRNRFHEPRIIISSLKEESTMLFNRVEVNHENQNDLFIKIKIARDIFNDLPNFINNPIFKLKEIIECL